MQPDLEGNLSPIPPKVLAFDLDLEHGPEIYMAPDVDTSMILCLII